MEPANSHRSPLLRRAGPRPPTQQEMPHTQIGVTPVAEVNAELFRRAFSLQACRTGRRSSRFLGLAACGSTKA